MIGLFLVASALWLGAQSAPGSQEAPRPAPYLEEVRVPAGLRAREGSRPLVVAIVDDGVRTSREDLRGLLWTNENEIGDNRVDDDGNGRVDDLHGWDVSDNNASVEPPAGRLETFGHGTHLAGILSTIVRHAYGDATAEILSILPVKALADGAQRTYLFDGYRGIDYAIDAGADVILAAWGSSSISEEEAAILAKARREGVMIVASAGNYSDGREQYPAAAKGVFAVAGIDRQGRKLSESNFGAFVDLSAPAESIPSADARSDTSRVERSGTSQAAAIVAAGIVLLASQDSSLSNEQIEACLKNSARPLAQKNPRYAAQLGAGILDLTGALQCPALDDGDSTAVLTRPQGFLRLTDRDTEPAAWSIAPHGVVARVTFTVHPGRGPHALGKLSFHAGPDSDSRSVGSWSLTELPESVFVPGPAAFVRFEPRNSDRGLDSLLEYRAEPVDLSRRYCSGTVSLFEPGIIEDGSLAELYSYDSDCKWLITAPEGQLVELRFVALDTEPKADSIYFFNGAGTHENIIAKISGSKIPPAITSWSNQILVWFVSNGDREGQGWELEYRFVSE